MTSLVVMNHTPDSANPDLVTVQVREGQSLVKSPPDGFVSGPLQCLSTVDHLKLSSWQLGGTGVAFTVIGTRLGHGVETQCLST